MRFSTVKKADPIVAVGPELFGASQDRLHHFMTRHSPGCRWHDHQIVDCGDVRGKDITDNVHEAALGRLSYWTMHLRVALSNSSEPPICPQAEFLPE